MANAIREAASKLAGSVQAGVDAVTHALLDSPHEPGAPRVADMLGSGMPYPGDTQADDPSELRDMGVASVDQGGAADQDKDQDSTAASSKHVQLAPAPASLGVNAGMGFHSAQDVNMGGEGERVAQAPLRVVAASPVEPAAGTGQAKGGRNPTQYAPVPGGPLTTIRDSSQMVNTGPNADSARSQGFGLTHQPGEAQGALAAFAENVTSLLGGAYDKAVGGERSTVASYPAGPAPGEEEPEAHRRHEELKEAMVGMPGNMPVDKELRELREAQLEERMAGREAAKAQSDEAARTALRESGAADEYMAPPPAPGTGGSSAELPTGGASGGGGGLLSSLAEKVSSALGLGDMGPMAASTTDGTTHAGGREHDEAAQGGQAQDLARKPVPIGTPPLEAKPYDKAAIGVPRAAEANAERAGASLNTKEAGQAVPAGALGATAGNPDQHVMPFAPDMAQPNFFKEVEQRGLADTLGGMVRGVVRGAERAADNIRHGGEPAPWSVASGAVSDTSIITRNVERAAHLDDPTQRKIYEAEVVKVRPGSHIQPHQTSQEEKEREAMHGMVLGMNKPVSGAVPHDTPEPGQRGAAVGGATPPKAAAAQGIYGSIGTGGV